MYNEIGTREPTDSIKIGPNTFEVTAKKIGVATAAIQMPDLLSAKFEESYQSCELFDVGDENCYRLEHMLKAKY